MAVRTPRSMLRARSFSEISRHRNRLFPIGNRAMSMAAGDSSRGVAYFRAADSRVS